MCRYLPECTCHSPLAESWLPRILKTAALSLCVCVGGEGAGVSVCGGGGKVRGGVSVCGRGG